MQINEVLEEGKRLTLYELMQSESWNIEIPIIQRDYAQGRPSTYEVRNTFVSTLLEHLISGDNIDLDFIYGSLKEDDVSIFVPLDGQQRLTTLFLLHWYLAHKEDERGSFLSIFEKEEKSRFSYETRTSSREFCDALVSHGLGFEELINDSIGETIKDTSWFYQSWEDDPTIQSMLTMLDEIHTQFKDTDNLYKKLLQTSNPVITFQFLNLDAFKLTDDLYIKMNARGKQLTPFENFKAKFEQYIKALPFVGAKQYSLKFESATKNVAIDEYFSFKIDTDWANLFWKYKNENTKVFDEQLMNLVKVMATNYVASQNNLAPSLKKLASKDSQTFKEYQTLGCLVPDFILSLIDTLDILKNGNETIQNYLPDDYYIDEDALFNKVIANNLTYIERIRFYALYQYLLRNGNDGGLNEWIRIIFNLTENSIYNELEEYTVAVNSVDRLLQHSKSILQYFSTSTERITGFLDLQVQEERIKACLLLKDATWYTKINELEKHEYFKGQISFLLNFSGIEAYFSQNNNCNWDAKGNKQFFDSITSYNEKALSIFDNGGLIKFSDFLFERALLTKGDYTLSSKSNSTFLVNTSRDISWKRLLRDDNFGKRSLVKLLLDDPNFDVSKIEGSLSTIISSSTVTDWRRHFIVIPAVIRYLGSSKFFRKRLDTDIQLLKRERLSGPHAEYYSYSLYQEELNSNKNNFSPFSSISYNEVSGDFYPWIRLSYDDRYIYMMIYRRNYPLDYQIKFRQLVGLDLNSKITDTLIQQGFNELTPSEYSMNVVTEADVLNVLNTICGTFKTQNL